MTTTSEKLLELAARYDEKAKALRLAAAELNGHLTTQAKGQIGSKLEAAIALRAASKARPRTKDGIDHRRAALRALLASGVTKTKALGAALQEQGIGVNRATIVSDLTAIGATQIGSTQQARWALPDETSSQPERPRSRSRSKSAKHLYKRTLRKQRQRTARLLAKIAEKGPVPFTAVGPAIGILVRRGYVEKIAEGYIRTKKEFTV